MTTDEFRLRLDDVGLSRWADQIVGLDRYSVRLLSSPDDGELATSRLGGSPDLPSGLAWPLSRGTPLAFIAQLNLADIPDVPDQPLPKEGLLSFFYDAEAQPWGDDPSDVDGWSVRYFGPSERLATAAPPDDLPAESRFPSRRLTPKLEVTHVGYESSELRALGMSDDERDSYADVWLLDDAPINAHRLLGHPDPVQGDMQLTCQLASQGMTRKDPRAEHERTGAPRWRLLLQIDSDPDADMAWGDDGRIYFWITDDALAKHEWESAWLVLQCS